MVMRNLADAGRTDRADPGASGGDCGFEGERRLNPNSGKPPSSDGLVSALSEQRRSTGVLSTSLA
jgi:hypothetical protein